MNQALFIMESSDRNHPEWGESTFSPLYHSFIEGKFSKNVMLVPLAKVPSLNEQLLQLCGATHPELIVFIPTGWIDVDPSRQTMAFIRDTLGIKVLMVRNDPGGPAGHFFTDSWFPFVSAIVFVDMSVSSLGYSDNPKAIQGYSFRSLSDLGLERDIDVSFSGSIGNWQKRDEYINFLRANGIAVVTGGGQEYDTRLSPEEFHKSIARSKIALNFCEHRTEGYAELKGRVFEAMQCRTMLLEGEGRETPKFFERGKDYVSFTTKEDLLEKVKYYLEHDSERQAIAEAGYKKVTDIYTSKNLWAYTLETIDLLPWPAYDTMPNYFNLVNKLNEIARLEDGTVV